MGDRKSARDLYRPSRRKQGFVPLGSANDYNHLAFLDQFGVLLVSRRAGSSGRQTAIRAQHPGQQLTLSIDGVTPKGNAAAAVFPFQPVLPADGSECTCYGVDRGERSKKRAAQTRGPFQVFSTNFQLLRRARVTGGCRVRPRRNSRCPNGPVAHRARFARRSRPAVRAAFARSAPRQAHSPAPSAERRLP